MVTLQRSTSSAVLVCPSVAPAIAEKTRQKNGRRMTASPPAPGPPLCCCSCPALFPGEEGGSPAAEVVKWWHLPVRRCPLFNAFRVLMPGGLQFPFGEEPGWKGNRPLGGPEFGDTGGGSRRALGRIDELLASKILGDKSFFLSRN